MLDHRLKVAIKVQTIKGTISNYENGHSTPSNEMLVLLARTLNTTDYLLGNTDLMNIESRDEAKFQAKKLFGSCGRFGRLLRMRRNDRLSSN